MKDGILSFIIMLFDSQFVAPNDWQMLVFILRFNKNHGAKIMTVPAKTEQIPMRPSNDQRKQAVIKTMA